MARDIPDAAAPNDASQARRLLSIRQLCTAHPAFTPGSVRWLLFKTRRALRRGHDPPVPGFQHCVFRVGRKVLIDEAAFLEWISQNPAN